VFPQLLKSADGKLVDSTQVLEIASTLEKPNTPAVRGVTQGTNASGALKRRSIRVQKRSAAVLDNNQQLAEKILTTALSAAAKAAKDRRNAFHGH